MIGSDEVDRCIRQGYMLVDLRKPSEYKKMHLKGAVNIPFEELESKTWMLPTDGPIILYCERGAASLQASKQLNRMGFYTISVTGGILSYRGRYLVK